ncbi:hypothetical protein BDR06DRAFT_178209 [Suillus hirtellus]|nr:hypothetical protein BDR06DRAFT_178209 [Suillus hirtellus]
MSLRSVTGAHKFIFLIGCCNSPHARHANGCMHACMHVCNSTLTSIVARLRPSSTPPHADSGSALLRTLHPS